MESTTPPAGPILSPLPYQRRILEYLKTQERALWDWFASVKFREEYARNVRLELLKGGYRLEREAHAGLYEVADRAMGALKLALPLTIYQAQGAEGLNASLAYVPGEAHLVFTGPVAARLTPDELLSVVSHELSHYLLLDGWGGEFLVAEQVLLAMSNHDAGRPPHFQSARLFRLYAELFADRGGFLVTGDAASGISGLVKLETGIETVSADAYLRQAEEIFSREEAATEKLSHPETYIRARALKLWAERGEAADAEVARMIEGPVALDALDLTGQQRLEALTRRLLLLLLRPRWFRSGPILTHARLFFDDFAPAAPGHEDDALLDELKASGLPVRDFACYVLLDFAAADPDLEEAPLAAAHAVAERLGWDDRLEELAAKELGLTKRKLAQVRRERDRILADAEREGQT